jgi:PEGA domain
MSAPAFQRVMAALALSWVFAASGAAAQGTDGTTSEAGRHFRRGVDLYGEADYGAALVEFRRAYELSPSSAALYNVGEAQFQLQDYAGALRTFRRFLVEFGPAEGHRAEVERDVAVLRTRVGHVRVTTIPPGADIAVDDQSAGKTPLDEPLLLSVGHRKLMASMTGRAPVAQYVDVAAEDNVSVTLELRALQDTTVPTRLPAPAVATSALPSPRSSSAALATTGWIAAGALAAGAITFGVLALNESSTLKSARNTFPTSAATVDHDANLTQTYSVLADSLTAAAIVTGGLALFWTLSPGGSDRPRRGDLPSSRVTLGAAAARFEMTF